MAARPVSLPHEASASLTSSSTKGNAERCIKRESIPCYYSKSFFSFSKANLNLAASKLSFPSVNPPNNNFIVKSSQGTAVTEEGTAVGIITEVNINSFHPSLEAAGDKLVVLDMFTQWCGPCKLIYPKIQKLAAEMEDVVFLKLDCNQENKPLAKELGIRVVPTFKLFMNKKVVAEVTGARYEVLEAEIRKLR